ncbi:hypothetical protein ZEAMMB73_Zm00001d041588 [Zea mays]|uniref:Enolase N-terminal domain-containing protein n=1 Tax=Zea mays TaxID=4577 RepID=A0A1D6MX12_MAIZE|nr:hypothetical protein ZEAMMB73_Zm00001d041588 [Zea mays]
MDKSPGAASHLRLSSLVNRGIYEALELRDGGSDYLGKGVLKEMAVTITWVKTRQIFISRGNPTVEVDVGLRDGSYARGAVPSGVSTGTSVCSMPPSPFTPRFCFSSAPVPEPLLGFIDLVSLIWACRGI